MTISEWYSSSHEKADLQLCETLLRKEGFVVSRGYTSATKLEFSLLAKKQLRLAVKLLTPDPLSEDEFWKKLKGIQELPGLAFNSRLSNLLTSSLVKKAQRHGVRLCPITDSTINIIEPTLTASQIQSQIRQVEATKLRNLLHRCQPGKKHWQLFEDICEELFSILFIPPLDYPQVQADTVLAIRRRDLIYPNRSSSGFWSKVVRHRYGGEYVLLECKNYRKPISTKEFDQGLRYLVPKGPGRFGIIVSRKAIQENVKVLQMVSWSNSNSMLLTLSEQNLRQMIDLYSKGRDPTRIIQEAIDKVRTAVP